MIIFYTTKWKPKKNRVKHYRFGHKKGGIPMKKVFYALIFCAVNSLTANVFAEGCASWMNCNAQTRNANYTSSDGNYQGNNFSSNNHDATTGSIWRDAYAAYDPRLMPTTIK